MNLLRLRPGPRLPLNKGYAPPTGERATVFAMAARRAAGRKSLKPGHAATKYSSNQVSLGELGEKVTLRERESGSERVGRQEGRGLRIGEIFASSKKFLAVEDQNVSNIHSFNQKSLFD